MMQQQGFVVCDVQEVKNLLKFPSFPTFDLSNMPFYRVGYSPFYIIMNSYGMYLYICDAAVVSLCYIYVCVLQVPLMILIVLPMS